MGDIFSKAGASIRESLNLSSDLAKEAADLEAFTDCAGGREKAKMLGVVVRDCDVKRQMAADSAKGPTYATESAAKMFAEYRVVLKQTANSRGQVARESDNYSNKPRRLNQRIADIRGNLGSAFIAPASTIVDKLSDLASDDEIDVDFSPRTRSASPAIGRAGAAKTGVLGVVSNLPGLKQPKDLGVWLAKLVPVGGRVGLVSKGLVRFAGPIGAVVGALQALKSGPGLLERFLNDWFPKIKDFAGKTLDSAIQSWIPAAGRWLGDLISGAASGALQIATRLGGIFLPKIVGAFFGEKAAKLVAGWFPETEAQRAYKLEKQLADERERTAAASEAAAEAEVARRSPSETAARYEENVDAIGLARATDDEREFVERSREIQGRIDAAQGKLGEFDAGVLRGEAFDGAARAETERDRQTARIELAKLQGGRAFDDDFAAFQERYETAPDGATTEEARESISGREERRSENAFRDALADAKDDPRKRIETIRARADELEEGLAALGDDEDARLGGGVRDRVAVAERLSRQVDGDRRGERGARADLSIARIDKARRVRFGERDGDARSRRVVSEGGNGR